jgi:type VI secretion system protein ImpA
MASDDVLDFARLLAPVPGENPAGTDLREDPDPNSVYRRIKGARFDAGVAERRVVYQDEEDVADAGRADWRPILELVPDTIAEKSKDLELAGMLLEGLTREHGYPGLRDGLRLVRELVEQYWDGLYPRRGDEDEDDEWPATVSSLAGLNGVEGGQGLLIRPIAKIPITGGRSIGPFSLLDHQNASNLEAEPDPDKRARRREQPGAVTKEMIDKAVSETSAEFAENLLEDIGQCQEECRRLYEVLDAKCGADESGFSRSPPSSAVRAVLEEARETLRRIAGHLLESDEAPPAEETGSLETVGAAGGGLVTQVQTREEAFRALLRAADFFKRTEPHSPVSYALEQAVRWGRMDLPDLLSELITDMSVREDLFRRVGIRPPDAETNH